jgi:hypothetical protein
VLGQGSNGAAGVNSTSSGGSGGVTGGGGGSGGNTGVFGAVGVQYGGGAPGSYSRRDNAGVQTLFNGFSGGNGAVRIIWPGNVRLFPSTRTADE